MWSVIFYAVNITGDITNFNCGHFIILSKTNRDFANIIKKKFCGFSKERFLIRQK